MKIDWSKGMALHRLYGHYPFAMEALKAGKDMSFIMTICSNLKCVGKSIDWRDNLEF